MTKKVTGNVRLRLVKPFNVKTDKMFAEVFASISSHPGQYYTGVHAWHTKRKLLIQRVSVYVILGISVPFI